MTNSRMTCHSMSSGMSGSHATDRARIPVCFRWRTPSTLHVSVATSGLWAPSMSRPLSLMMRMKLLLLRGKGEFRGQKYWDSCCNGEEELFVCCCCFWKDLEWKPQRQSSWAIKLAYSQKIKTGRKECRGSIFNGFPYVKVYLRGVCHERVVLHAWRNSMPGLKQLLL